MLSKILLSVAIALAIPMLACWLLVAIRATDGRHEASSRMAFISIGVTFVTIFCIAFGNMING